MLVDEQEVEVIPFPTCRCIEVCVLFNARQRLLVDDVLRPVRAVVWSFDCKLVAEYACNVVSVFERHLHVIVLLVRFKVEDTCIILGYDSVRPLDPRAERVVDVVNLVLVEQACQWFLRAELCRVIALLDLRDQPLVVPMHVATCVCARSVRK